MDVIAAYLDTMFSPYPTTPRLVEAKAELRAMMEDKYTELIASGHSENEAVGQVITEFGNLDELAPLLGISTDLGDAKTAPASGTVGAAPSAWSQTPDPGTAAPHSPPADPPITLEEAQGLAHAMEATRWRVALAVAGFVVSPVPLLFDSAPLLGIVVLLVIVAACVLTLVGHGSTLRPFERVRSGRFTPTPEVDAWAADLVEAHEPQAQRALLVAIGLWILSAIPTIAFATLDGSHDGSWAFVGVALTLVMVAVGLCVLLTNSWAKSAAKKVTQEGRLEALKEHASEKDPVANAFAAVYWPVVVLVYLTWSFLGDAWDRSWVIWPITGILFGAIMAALAATRSLRDPRV